MSTYKSTGWFAWWQSGETTNSWRGIPAISFSDKALDPIMKVMEETRKASKTSIQIQEILVRSTSSIGMLHFVWLCC